MKACQSADPLAKKQMRVFEMMGLVLGAFLQTWILICWGTARDPGKMLQPGGIQLREGFSILPAAAGFFIR